MKTILITGAGTGIGKDSAIALVRRGHRVIATTETEEQAAQLRVLAEQKSVILEVFKLDITVPEDQQKIDVYEIDVLVNNAGTGESGSLAEIPLERVRKNFEVNVFSTIALTQRALRGMFARKTGTVIVVSSIAGRVPQPFLSTYSMTKFALSGGMAALRKEIHEVEKNIHIVLVEPGTYATGFNQRMFEKKYEWMKEGSYFSKIREQLRNREERMFRRLEERSTKGIVDKIVVAAEATHPKLRYVAPRYQGLAIALMRMFGV